jgi:type IV secretory pathway VirB4 component
MFDFLKNRPTKQEKTLEKNVDRESTSLLDTIAPASFVVTPNYLQLNELFVRTCFVYSYPRFLNTNWMSPVVNSDVVMDIAMHISPLDSRMFVTHLRKQQGKLESSRQIEQEKGFVRNPELDTAVADIDSLREDLQTGQQRIYKYGLYFTIYAKSIEELNTLTDQIESTLGGMLINTKQTIFQMEQGFNSTLPLGLDQINIAKNLDTNTISTTFPFVSATLSGNEGILYGINRHNNSLILFDRFKLENANLVVFAKSGAGKSYTIKLEALRSLMFGTDVLVIDPENEYKALTNAVGGSYFEMSLNSEKRINPFDLPKATVDETGEMVLRSAVSDLTGLVSIMVGGLSPEESAILDKAIYETYALRDITTDIKSHSNPPPLLQDLRNVLQNMNGAQSLTQRLSKYVDGSFAGLFNQPTNFELDRGMVCFSIRNLEDQLRPVGMYMILNYVWSKIRHLMRKRVLVIDEAWLLMQFPDSARYVYSLAKRARKYYLGLTIISQDVEDFLNSEQGRAVLNNSSLQILLKQSPTAVEKLAEVFHLTEGEKFLLLESNVGEGLFFAGTNHVAIQVVASYAEDQIITTDPAQLLAAKETQETANAPTQVISSQMEENTGDQSVSPPATPPPNQ